MAGTRHTPREAPAYGAAEIAAGAQGNFGIHIIRPGCNIQVKKPSWNGTETVFRPFPSVRHDKPDEFWPYRIDPEGSNYFGHCIRRYPCAWGVGTPGVTFLLNDPAAGDRTFDVWNTPVGILYKVIEQACKQGQGRPEWYPLREGGKGRGKALGAPRDLYLMQGVMLKHNDKPTFDAKRAPLGWGANPTLILMLSSGAGENLVKQLNLENEPYHGDPRDFEARYVNGDPFGLENGRYMHFYESGHDPRLKLASQPTGGKGPDPFNATGGGGPENRGGSDDIRGFEMFMTKELTPGGVSARFDDPGRVATVRDKWWHWEDILFFPTPEEQVRLLAKSFPASAILYAFSGAYDSWIPEDVRKIAVAALSINVPVQPPASPLNPFGGPLATPGTPGLANQAFGSPAGWPNAVPGGLPNPPAAVTPPLPGGDPFSDPVEPVKQDTVVPAGAVPESAAALPAGLGFAAPPEVATPKQTAEAIAKLAAARNKLKT